MLGSKIGTGGPSGPDHRQRPTEKNRIFTPLFSMRNIFVA
ncbi:hypothetical protein [Alishewanella longhuensis]